MLYRSYILALPAIFFLIIMNCHLNGQEPTITKDAIINELELIKQKESILLKKLQLMKDNAKDKNNSVDLYQVQMNIPRLPVAPKIDGVMSENEWDYAVSMPLPAGVGWIPLKERPSSVVYLGWDADNFYMAQKLKMRKGEKLKRYYREPKHDNVHVALENTVELYIDRGTSGSHASKCRWQFMGNSSGNRWDTEDQYEIGQRYVFWDADWQYKQKMTADGVYWVTEMAIPRTSIYKNTPIVAGEKWNIGFAISLIDPLTWSGYYGWNIPATLTDNTPIIRMQSQPAKILTERGFVFDLGINNVTKNAFKSEVIAVLREGTGKNAKIVQQKSWKVNVPSGESKFLNINEKFSPEIKDLVKYDLSLAVKDGNKSIYTWQKVISLNNTDNKFGLNYTPDLSPITLTAIYAPIHKYVRIGVDKYDFDESNMVKIARYEVYNAKSMEKIASGVMPPFEYGKSEIAVDVPELPVGEYVCEINLVDANDKSLVKRKNTFNVKDIKVFPWINNTIGLENHIPEPFTPLSYKGKEINAFKKTITTGSLGLPEKIIAADQEILTSSIRLEGKCDGASFTGNLDGTSASMPVSTPQKACFVGSKILSDSAQVKVNTEWGYDSTAKIKLRLIPGKKISTLEDVKIVIPYSQEVSLNYMAVGISMRISSQAGRIPGKDKTGIVWTSKDVPAQKMTKGSFVPVVWIGNRIAGMTWFADSDHGWWPDDNKPAIEIFRRKDGGVDLVLNISSGKVKLDKEREIVFGLNINPVRKMSDYITAPQVFGYTKETGRYVPGKSNREEFALRYPQDPERNKLQADALHKYGMIYGPYSEMSKMDIPEDVYKYFIEDLEGNQGAKFGVMPGKAFNDCVLYYTKKWIEDCGGDGFYFDNYLPRISYNVKTGSAYTLPDGRIQPGFCMWGFIDHIKRIRVLFDMTRPKYRLLVHNTRFQFAPVMAYADLAMGGEMATPSMGTPDFMEMYPREFMEIMYNPYLWGYRITHLYHFKSKSYVDKYGLKDNAAADKVHRGAMATMIDHGVEMFNYYDNDSLQNKFQLFKKMNGGFFEFIPLWNSKGLFSLLNDKQGKNGSVSVLKGKDGILVVLTNYSNKDIKMRVELDLPKLVNMPGKFEQRTVADFETFDTPGGLFEKQVPEEKKYGLKRINSASSQSMMKNVLSAKVKAHDFRIFMIANIAVSKSWGF